MSDEQEVVAVSDKNFRSAYYKSLGFRKSEKSVSHLELLLKAEVFDVKKLKEHCLKHTLTVYYRPMVWKIVLSVIPVFTDKDTCTFVQEQKRIEFYDLKRALQVMGRLEHAAGREKRSKHHHHHHSPLSADDTVGEISSYKCDASSSSSFSKGLKQEIVAGGLTSQQPSTLSHRSSPDRSSPLLSSHFPSQSNSHSSTLPPQSLSQPPLPIPPPPPPPAPASALPSSGTNPQSVLLESLTTSQEHRPLSQNTPQCTPRDFVLVFLLENNQLLSASVHQMKQEEQVNRIAIAEAFFQLFEDENEDCNYWLFSNFIKKLESLLVMKEEMVQSFDTILEDIDCELAEHIKDLGAYENDSVPILRWFSQCYARELPESCLESVWDRVIGGSCMILVYLAVSILLTFKRKIFSFSSSEQLQYLLHNIPKDNFGPIVSKAIELWDSHGSPLLPSNSKIESSPLHEFYEIEDYS